MSRSRVAVVVLPGGTDVSEEPYSRRSPAALRMYPFTASIRARFAGRASAYQVAYGQYGWNEEKASPMPYGRAALDAIAHRHPDSPIVLIGHSMGGRVGAHLADDKRVTDLLALAPWWQFDDWRCIHDGVRVHAIHGGADERTMPRKTSQGISELRDRGLDATYTEVPGGGHAMLDHTLWWQRQALRFVADSITRA